MEWKNPFARKRKPRKVSDIDKLEPQTITLPNGEIVPTTSPRGKAFRESQKLDVFPENTSVGSSLLPPGPVEVRIGTREECEQSLADLGMVIRGCNELIEILHSQKKNKRSNRYLIKQIESQLQEHLNNKSLVENTLKNLG